MRSPKDFFRPKAIGAPEPPREIAFRPSRMIHFFDPSNPKMASKVPELAKRCDVLRHRLVAPLPQQSFRAVPRARRRQRWCRLPCRWQNQDGR